MTVDRILHNAHYPVLMIELGIVIRYKNLIPARPVRKHTGKPRMQTDQVGVILHIAVHVKSGRQPAWIGFAYIIPAVNVHHAFSRMIQAEKQRIIEFRITRIGIRVSRFSGIGLQEIPVFHIRNSRLICLPVFFAFT